MCLFYFYACNYISGIALGIDINLLIDSAVTQSSSVSNTFLIIKYFEFFTEIQ